MNKLRWGILSTAGIARKNWRAIRDSGNSIVTAVASREQQRSRDFIDRCQSEKPVETTPKALGSYEELIASPEVDAVYIPLPTGLRKPWVLRAAAAGKHVLCEKPCGLNAADVQEMIAACQRNGVQFMDGVMFMHNPRMDRLRQALDDAQGFGEIKRITSIFSFVGAGNFFDANIRVNGALEPTGCLGDLGWYCIRFSLWSMHWKMPLEVSGRILSERGNKLAGGSAPTDFSGELLFDGETSTGFYSSFLAEHQQWVDVSGAKGQLRLADFVHATSEHEPSFELKGQKVSVPVCDCVGAHNASRFWAQDSAMFRNFTNQVRSGKLNDAWPMWALKTQQVTDACFESARNGSRPVRLER